MRGSRRRQVRATDVVGLSRAATRWDLGLVSGRKVARPGSRAAHSVRTATASAQSCGRVHHARAAAATVSPRTRARTTCSRIVTGPIAVPGQDSTEDVTWSAVSPATMSLMLLPLPSYRSGVGTFRRTATGNFTRSLTPFNQTSDRMARFFPLYRRGKALKEYRR